MATTQVETVNTGADKAKLAAAVALVIASVAGFYLLGKQGPIVNGLRCWWASSLLRPYFWFQNQGGSLSPSLVMLGVKSKRWYGLRAKKPFR